MINWLPVALNVVLLLIAPVVVFFSKTYIDASIRANLERKGDELRSDLRTNEEHLKSELRAKEVEVSATLEKVLSGVGSRQALVDERRLKAIEAIWLSVKISRQFKGIASTLGVLNLAAVSAAAPKNPKMREFATAFVKDNPQELLSKHDGFQERPFISDPAWAYFSAYHLIMTISVA